MTDAVWTLLFFVLGLAIGAGIVYVNALRTSSVDSSAAYRRGHSDGFAQGRQVSNKAAIR